MICLCKSEGGAVSEFGAQGSKKSLRFWRLEARKQESKKICRHEVKKLKAKTTQPTQPMLTISMFSTSHLQKQSAIRLLNLFSNMRVVIDIPILLP